jgi:hypothetical protein
LFQRKSENAISIRWLSWLNNQSPEKNELISRELKASGISENRKIGEILEVFIRAEITKDEQKNGYPN